ncbi:hypothetical protein KC727_00370 [Candidatus Kaiserbacteria bacterium]|nr:hypothetical protein [Candidatus Kaiserbacteria bacterium]
MKIDLEELAHFHHLLEEGKAEILKRRIAELMLIQVALDGTFNGANHPEYMRADDIQIVGTTLHGTVEYRDERVRLTCDLG